MWTKHDEDSWFREDITYAGKDHTKNNKTFIALSNTGDEAKGFKTLQAAMDYADKTWPQIK